MAYCKAMDSHRSLYEYAYKFVCGLIPSKPSPVTAALEEEGLLLTVKTTWGPS